MTIHNGGMPTGGGLSTLLSAQRDGSLFSALGPTILVVIVIILVITILLKTVVIVPQARAIVVERFGKFQAEWQGGLHFMLPIMDRVVAKIDLREQVVSFPPQPVITSDNVTVSIDSVVYYQVNEPARATYEIANFIQAIEQLTVTTLRNVIGSMDLEATLTSRDHINGQLRGVLDEATGNWGIRINRVELKAIEPPPSIQQAMEKQMRAERDKRATILTAQGRRESEILTAEGEKQSAILRAEGEAKSAVLQAQGEAEAIQKVFDAIHAGNPDPKLLAYQYLQMLPKLSEGEGSKVWVVPTELTAALQSITEGFGGADKSDSSAN